MQTVQATWRTTEPAERTRERIIAVLGEPARVEGGTYRWHGQRTRGFERLEAVYDESRGAYTFTVAIPEVCKYVIGGAAVLVVGAAVVDADLVQRWLAIGTTGLFYAVMNAIQIPLLERYDLAEYTVSPYYFATLLLAAGAITTSPYLTNKYTPYIVLFTVTLLVGVHYAQGSLPIPDRYAPPPRQSPSYLQIPIAGLVAPFGAYILLTVFASLRLSPLGYPVVILGTIACSLVGTWMYAVGCMDLLEKLRQAEFGPFDSRGVRVLTTLIYLVLNVAAAVMLYIALEILTFGATGRWLTFEEGESTVLFTEIYSNLDQQFAVLPIVPPRVGSLVFMALVFLPIFAFMGAWLYHLYANLRDRLQLLRRSTALDDEFDAVTDGVTLRCVETDRPLVFPVSLALGWREYIVVSTTVYTSLSDEQFNALLAHEVYHLRNKDLLVNALASISALGAFGGPNALLAFYDYPRIEEAADDFAVEQVGATPLVGALRRMEALQHQQTTIDDAERPLVLGTPRLLTSAIPYDQFRIENPASRVEAVVQSVIRPVYGFYELFFGRVLFDEAHRSVDERVARIVDDETGGNTGS